MKPLSELVKEIPDVHCTTRVLLEAWLRGWHEELDKAESDQRPDSIGPMYGMAISAARKWIRTELLGTTPKPKQEGE